MYEVALFANLVFLILMIIFGIKLRADFQTLKKQIPSNTTENTDIKDLLNKIKELTEKLAIIEGKILSCEEKIVSVEFENKELRERLGEIIGTVKEKLEQMNHLSKELKEIREKLILLENSASPPKNNVEKEYNVKNEIKEEESESSKKAKLVIKYAQEGKTEEEIAKLTGLSYEEVKLMLKIKK
jgi:chromosome segregation ATPase